MSDESGGLFQFRLQPGMHLVIPEDDSGFLSWLVWIKMDSVTAVPFVLPLLEVVFYSRRL